MELDIQLYITCTMYIKWFFLNEWTVIKICFTSGLNSTALAEKPNYLDDIISESIMSRTPISQLFQSDDSKSLVSLLEKGDLVSQIPDNPTSTGQEEGKIWLTLDCFQLISIVFV